MSQRSNPHSRSIAALLCSFWLSSALASCPPEGQTAEGLKRLASDGFVVVDSTARQGLALALVDCLEDSDPDLRDTVAFTGLSTWMRGGHLDSDTVRELRSQMVARLKGEDDELRLRHTFAALTLAELARVDRIEPVYSEDELAELVDVAEAFLQQIDDYRDFDPKLGWRHQVAHGSDLVLQLVINPRVEAPAAARLLDALAPQVAPAGVAYTAGEPQRIARAVHFAQQRDVLDTEWWQGWMTRAVPSPIDPSAPMTTDRVDARHNRIAFLLALHYAASGAANARGAELQSLINGAMQRAN